MVRIDTTDTAAKWRYTCPAPPRHRNWRVIDGVVQCRSCDATYQSLWDLEAGKEIARENIDFVGPHADTKGAFGDPGGV